MRDSGEPEEEPAPPRKDARCARGGWDGLIEEVEGRGGVEKRDRMGPRRRRRGG